MGGLIMKTNAPEKIYIFDNPILDFAKLSVKQNDKDVEYTRTDAFINKATEWLCYNYDKYIRIIGSSVYPAYAELCKDFQKAMKGE